MEWVADKKNLVNEGHEEYPIDEYDKGYLDGVGRFFNKAKQALTENATRIAEAKDNLK